MAEKYYTSTGEEYFPNATYEIYDKNGNVIATSKGDNGYVWQSVTSGVPISINKKGEWYVTPYIESDGQKITAHIPSWFKATPEYEEWSTISAQIPNLSLTKDRLSQMNDILKSLGNQGVTRQSLSQEIASYGVNSPENRNKYYEWMTEMGWEGSSKNTDREKAKISGLVSDEESPMSVAEIARQFKDLSKEELSGYMTNLYDIAEKGKNGEWDGSEEEMLRAVSMIKLLNYVDDNYTGYGDKNFGENDEFQGLLSASFLQNLNATHTSFMQTMAENFPIINLFARAIYGAGEVISGRPFSFEIERNRDILLNLPSAGGGLEGREAAMQVGDVTGTVANIAGTMFISVKLGNFISGKAATATPGGFVSRLGDFAKTIPGAMATDFFLNDIPIDLMFFASDWMRTGDIGKAWYNAEEEQPLFGVPIIGHFGPSVPGGLGMNLLGDAIIDVSLPILSIVGNTSFKKLDQWTSGGVTRAREKAFVTNLRIQKTLTDIPVIGAGWKKFVNHMMGAENANFIREARKASIISGSSTPYVVAQNLLTLYNHAGLTDIAPLYKMLDSELEISKDLKRFLDRANELGGVGETRINWKKVEGGVESTLYKIVPDVMPRDVKRVLLDTERLSELKGEKINEGGVLFNPARDREIADLEARLAKAPEELKNFADRFSQLNKRVEELGVKLGVTKQEWLDVLNQDPRWQSYMTRQAITPGGTTAGGATDPSNAAILNKSRKGSYNVDDYIDPQLALAMKVEALGRAYAWNERAKALVDFEIIQGKITAGKGSVEAARRLDEVKAEIRTKEGFRQEIGYDGSVSSYGKDMNTVSDIFARENELLHLPESINLKSIYNARQNPRINSFIDDFETGKIQFADGVKEAAGLSDSDAAAIIKNTYSYAGNKLTKNADNIIPDTIKRDKSSIVDLDYSAGVTDSGVPYKYTVEDGKITKFEEITDNEGMAAALSNLTGVFGITPETVDRIGAINTRAINRTVLFYRDTMPLVGGASATFKIGAEDYWGWIPPISSPEYGWKVVNGKLEADQYPVYLGPEYRKGNESSLLSLKRSEVSSGYKPANTATAESTPTHENGHTMIVRLTQERINRMVDEGELTLPHSQLDLEALLIKEHDKLQDELIDRAMKKIGFENYTEADITRQAATISEYASSLPYKRTTTGKHNRAEVFAEAVRMYQGNGANSSRFCLAVVEEMKKEGERFVTAAQPGAMMKKNGLTPPKGLIKNGVYAFPSKTNTDVSRAKWLDSWRQKNPYIVGKKKFTEEDYRKANLWDTFFQKEVRAYDPKSTSSMPNALAKKNGDFLEELASTSAKTMVEEIKKASIKGFSEELATMALSRNSRDITDAMESFIIRRVNQAAEEIAKKMPDGATFDNLTKARATLWSEDIIKNDSVNMLSSLVPDGDIRDIQSFVNNLFDSQAKGFATADVLPIETKGLLAEKEKLQKELTKSNNYALSKIKAADEARTGYVGDVTQMIHYKEGGEDVYVMVSDPVVASILKRPTNFKETGMMAESIASLSNFVSRMYRIGTTGISPLAFVRNVLRDPMQATIQGGFNPLSMSLSPEVFYHTLRNYGLDDDTITTVTNRLRNWAASSTLTQEMRNMGGVNSGAISYRNGVERLSKELRNPTNKPGKLVNKVIEMGEAPLETWESLFRNQIAQQSFVKNYQRSGNVNQAMAAAMFDASNSTTNFSHSIGMFKRATSTVPYLSSAINGVRSFWTQFNADPVGMVGRITAGFMVPAMAITAWNMAEDDRKQRYVNLPEWFRDSHIVLLDLEGNAIAFPIPEELQQFYGTARRLIEYTGEVNRQGIPAILAQGAFGFLPADVDGYFKDDGSIDFGRGSVQMLSGLMPQVVTTIYEFIKEEDLFTGQDLSNYDGLNKTINILANIFGTSVKNWANDIGMLVGAPSKRLVGKSTMDTLARDLFGMGFNEASAQFMNMIGKQEGVDETGKETEATGLFAENKKLKKQIEGLDKKIASSTGETKQEYERQKQQLIDDFSQRVANLVNNYMNLYTVTGGLEDWQKSRIVSILTLGGAYSSAASDTYQYQSTSEAYLNERALAQQRYIDAGLPAGASQETLFNRDNSIEVQAALNRFYGVPKQAAADFENALKTSGLKDIRDQFFDAIDKVYDLAEETNTKPDYDMIEKIQARYLQAVDGILAPIINQYGINILNNNDFINEVRSYVNGMVPNNDWSQSGRNAKKYISKKEFPLATVDVKKWLIQRYSSGIKNRNIDSDPVVTERLQDIKATIDRGDMSAAKGKIEAMRNGINKANFYISSTDYQTLLNYYNMVK